MLHAQKRSIRYSGIAALIFLAVGGLGVVQSGPALAAGLPNDNFANATPISALPFSDSGDLNGATVESGEPQFCNSQVQTIWYSFTPAANTTVTADLNGSSSAAVFNVYQQTGSGFGGLSFQSCGGAFGEPSTFTAQAGVTYYFQVGSVQTGSISFAFHVQAIPPPANDDFANATPVGALPFIDTVNHAIAATTEPGEPLACGGGGQSGSVWWAFTPSVSGSYSASTGNGLGPFTTLAAFQGTSLADLTQVGCAGAFSVLTFQASAGHTYFFQASGPWKQAPDSPLDFQLEVTPQPVANLFFNPTDPSIFDTIQFFDESTDPAEAGFKSEAWDFGDGTTGTGSDPTHRYAADGDYTVHLTVTTTDGRTASTSQVVHVRTHDVAITKFTVPTSASPGQTRSITVGITDKHYPETVQVQLLTGNAQGGFDQVGTLTEQVTPTTGGSSIPFAFSYTFTKNDATVGKVTFEAIATIQGARDALPADNTMIATTSVH